MSSRENYKETGRVADETRVRISGRSFGAHRLSGAEGTVVKYSGGTEGMHKIRLSLFTKEVGGDRVYFEEWFPRRCFEKIKEG